jgi:hypothetical protein
MVTNVRSVLPAISAFGSGSAREGRRGARRTPPKPSPERALLGHRPQAPTADRAAIRGSLGPAASLLEGLNAQSETRLRDFELKQRRFRNLSALRARDVRSCNGSTQLPILYFLDPKPEVTHD